MDNSLVIMEGGSFLYFVTPMDGSVSLWKVVCCWDFVTPMDGSLVIMDGIRCWDFVTPLDGSLVIMEGSSLLRFC